MCNPRLATGAPCRSCGATYQQARDGSDEVMELRFDKMGGLVPAIVQDAETGEVLMCAFINEDEATFLPSVAFGAIKASHHA